MKIALFQNNTTVGAIETNTDLVIEGARKAKDEGADIALFPELAIPGYPPWDLLERPSFIDACAAAEAKIASSVPARHPSGVRQRAAAPDSAHVWARAPERGGRRS